MKKLQLFDQNHGLSSLKKCQFCGFLKPMFLLFRKACLLYKTSKIVFFTIYFHDLCHGNTGGYKGIPGVTRGYRGLEGVKGVKKGYKGLQGVAGGDKGLQGVTKDYRNFFLTRTFPDTFSWSILHKNQS